VIEQKEIAIGLQIEKPKWMDGQESHPELQDMKSEFCHGLSRVVVQFDGM